MELIDVTRENLEEEHICCAISNNKDCQVMSKKAWLGARFADGLIFKKGNVRGKCFIEYIPGEKAWAPIEAQGYMYINCLWVSGQCKGQGYANLLLEDCIRDCKEKGKKGLVVLSSPKKMPFLSDPKFLKYKGFQLADETAPYFQLLFLPFQEGDATIPRFKDCVKVPKVKKDGFVLYYGHQCPFTAKYVPLIEAVAKAKGIAFQAIPFETTKEAQNAPTPFTSYSLFYQGAFVTNEILSEKKFRKMIEEQAFLL